MSTDATEIWDALIVGAGPAGSVSAALLAARGWRVLLVEKAAWPRDKPCGGCINAAAVALLQQAGLGHVLHDAATLDRMTLHIGKRQLHIPLPPGAAIERREFDARLVAEACARGCIFWPQTTARLVPANSPTTETREIRLEREGKTLHVQARIMLACDGLRGTLLADEPWAVITRGHPVRLGFAATLARDYPAGTLGMYLGRAGYVGLVRLADGRTHIGAALGPKSCHAQGGPLPVIAQILQSCDEHILANATPEFRGTGPLTAHRATIAGTRVLAIGDACGYVEPFTGEGISWAIRGATEAARLLPQHAKDWQEDFAAAWQQRYAATIQHRQRWCWRLRPFLQRPRLAAGCLTIARCLPAAPALLARKISA